MTARLAMATVVHPAAGDHEGRPRLQVSFPDNRYMEMSVSAGKLGPEVSVDTANNW
jgi:hypothetical protein